jgi:hypothetical protein
MLKGEKITLRPLKIEDLDKTNKWRNNLELTKLTQGVRFPKTLEMDKSWFESALNDRSNRSIYFGVDENGSNEFVGIVQLNDIDFISGTAQMGFVLGEPRHRGKGYGYEFSRLLINYAFLSLNLRKLITYNIASNDSTLIMQKKLGFHEEGRLSAQVYNDGIYHDVVIMALFKDDFLI